MSDDESGIKMRYSRERRLKNAPVEIKALYERRAGKRRGFLSMMRGNNGLLFLFGTIVLAALIALGLPYLLGQDRGKRIGPYRVFLEARLEDGAIAMSVELYRSARAIPKQAEYEAIVIRTSTDAAIFSAREFALSGSKEEIFYFRIPVVFPPEAVECILDLGKSQVSVRVPLQGGTESSEKP